LELDERKKGANHSPAKVARRSSTRLAIRRQPGGRRR
jgi:hypothetical protein